jgi:hypothetical protein
VKKYQYKVLPSTIQATLQYSNIYNWILNTLCVKTCNETDMITLIENAQMHSLIYVLFVMVTTFTMNVYTSASVHVFIAKSIEETIKNYMMV